MKLGLKVVMFQTGLWASIKEEGISSGEYYDPMGVGDTASA
jgi:hypothetical protein